MSPFPQSVYEFGDWLVAHPYVTRVRLDVPTFARYLAELDGDLRFGAYLISEPIASRLTPLDRYFTWRNSQAVFHDYSWADRRSLWPPHMYRR